MNEKIFKSYDIRGVYPTDFDEQAAHSIGQAFAEYTGAQKVVVGRDMRIGSPEIAQKLIEGLTSQGVNVDDIGQVSIDAMYFSAGTYEYGAGMMVTASHNPKEYNGIKMVVKKNGKLEWIRGRELYGYLKNRDFKSKSPIGKMTQRDIIGPFIQHVLSFVDVNKIKPFTVVVDAGNGMAGKIMPLLFKHLPCKLVPLNFELDGNFPAHPSNPLLPESQIQAKQKVIETKADFGVIIDGDTDRLFFVTEKGEFVRADATLLVLAKHFLKLHPGGGIAYNVICSKAVPQRIREWGGRPLRSAVGFANLAKAMQEHDGVMSGELSAHYAFRDNFYADSGFIVFLILLSLISEENKPLSKIVTGLIPYAKGDEINLEVTNIPPVIEKVKQHYADGHQDELDGITVEYADWWFNVRPSNTEPLLRITVEADTPELLKQKQQELVEFITQWAR
ncbi:MAG: phosphomannomutase/phosphoglucomutase [Parcubacteria group bacterium]